LISLVGSDGPGTKRAAGRPRGRRNRLNTEMLEGAASMRKAKVAIENGELPLEFLLQVVRDRAGARRSSAATARWRARSP
jgi:hypothetical protein